MCVFGGWDGTLKTYRDSVPGNVIMIMYNMACNVNGYYHDCCPSRNSPTKNLKAKHTTLAPAMFSFLPTIPTTVMNDDTEMGYCLCR